MCGILGVLSKKNNLEKYKNVLNVLKHRGPDDEGVFINENIFLGQRRLAIIDLSPSGKQPMSLKCKKTKSKLIVNFNGEIYNYKDLKRELENLGHSFFSNSDTEVILHSYEEWGNEAFSKFRGMFAIALYDENRKELILIRDRFGIKPLYYYFDENNFVFASEIKTFWSIDFIKKEIRDGALEEFLFFGYLLQPNTFYKNIFALEAGHYLKIKINNENFEIKKEKFADIKDYYILPKEQISLEEAIKKTKEALLDSLKYHLVSDVEVGLFLSGGIDSTVLLYLMRELKQEKIKTVSAIFLKTIYDESEKINELVQKFNTNHLELKITGKDFLENLDNIFYHMDEPTIDGVNTYFVSLAAKKAGLKVVLSGLGGDELFYGYPSFFDLTKINKIKPILKYLVIGYLLKLFAGEFNIKLNKLADIINSKNLKEAYLIYRRIFGNYNPKHPNVYEFTNNTNEKNRNEHSDLFVNSDKFVSHSDCGLNHLDDSHIRTNSYNSDYDLISFLEMSYYLKNQLLRDSDVFSMAHSIELRVPFIDNILFEKIAPIPDEYKIKNNISKFLLKEIIKDKVSDKILKQKKQGFVVPIELWLKNEAKEILQKELLNNNIFDRKKTEKMLNLFYQNKLHWSRLWAIFVLNRFLNL
jgi:asparagine synthase (glutamine-hydrolysing)